MKETRIKTEIFEDFIKNNGLSRTRFCKLCGINYKTYLKILNQDFNFDVRALFKIARYIKMEVYQLLEEVE